MKRFLAVLSVIGLIVSALPPASWGQEATVRGTIYNISPGPPARLLVLVDRQIVQVTVTRTTVIQIRNVLGQIVQVQFPELQVGDEIVVTFRSRDEARAIQIVSRVAPGSPAPSVSGPAPSPPPPAPSSPPSAPSSPAPMLPGPQAPGARSAAACLGESLMVSALANMLAPKIPYEIELTIVNRGTVKVHFAPDGVALISELGDQTNPLNPEQAKAMIRNPSSYFASWFFFGILGLAIDAVVQTERLREVDKKMMREVDVFPGAIVKGTLYFRPPSTKTGAVTLFVDSLVLESGQKAPAIRMNCQIPRVRQTAGTEPASTPSKPMVVAVAAQASAGPILVSASAAEFGQEVTLLVVELRNSGEVEAELFNAIALASLIDSTGRAYGLRALRSDIPERLPPKGALMVKLAFEPLPPPPQTTSAVLAIPGIKVGGAILEVRLDLRFQ